MTIVHLWLHCWRGCSTQYVCPQQCATPCGSVFAQGAAVASGWRGSRESAAPEKGLSDEGIWVATELHHAAVVAEHPILGLHARHRRAQSMPPGAVIRLRFSCGSAHGTFMWTKA